MHICPGNPRADVTAIICFCNVASSLLRNWFADNSVWERSKTTQQPSAQDCHTRRHTTHVIESRVVGVTVIVELSCDYCVATSAVTTHTRSLRISVWEHLFSAARFYTTSYHSSIQPCANSHAQPQTRCRNSENQRTLFHDSSVGVSVQWQVPCYWSETALGCRGAMQRGLVDGGQIRKKCPLRKSYSPCRCINFT